MPIQNTTQTIDLTAGGGTENLPVFAPTSMYIIQSTGSVTLTSNWTIQESGTPTTGLEYHFRYEADITPDGNTITVFGRALPDTLYDKTHDIIAYYDGTDWEVNFIVDVDENGAIPLSVIESNPFRAVTCCSRNNG